MPRAKLTPEQVEIVTRNIVRSLSHRTLDEVVQVVRERTNPDVTVEYVRQLRQEYTESLAKELGDSRAR